MARNLQRVRLSNVEQEPGASGAAETEEFMSVAAHDLRNPIAVVRASAQMAQRQINRGDTNGAQLRLKSIIDQTDRLTEMLESFLDAARLTAGNLPLRTEHLSLADVVEMAAERTRAVIGDYIKRDFDIDIPDGCVGAWDRMRIVRAVRALLINAVIYGDPEQPVRVHGRRDKDRVRLDISGGGPGPDEDEMPHLFERFFRGKSAADAGQSGSGLGLFTARGIARLHGGEVRRLETDHFEIELPLAS